MVLLADTTITSAAGSALVLAAGFAMGLDAPPSTTHKPLSGHILRFVASDPDEYENDEALNFEDFTEHDDAPRFANDPDQLDSSPLLFKPASRLAFSSSVSLASTLSTGSSELGLDNLSVMELHRLCDLIATHPFLQRAEILGSESYAGHGHLYSHRFLILELRTFNGEEIYLRLERRRSRKVGKARLLRNGGERPANDLAQFSAHKRSLMSGSTRENRQTFVVKPKLGELQFFLRAACKELATYRVWPENCCVFVSLVQQFLHGRNRGVFIQGALQFTKVSKPMRQGIRENLRLAYHMPLSFSLAELLRSFERCGSYYPSAIRALLPATIKLASSWDERPTLKASRDRVSADTLARNVQEIARRLKHNQDYHVEATILWEESGKILRRLHKRNAKRHQSDFARSLHFHSIYLQRAGDSQGAAPISREAVLLRRQLHNAQSESLKCCSSLAASLDNYANTLRALGRFDDAQVAKQELIVLRRQIFLQKSNRPAELPAFAHDFGDFLLQSLSDSDS